MNPRVQAICDFFNCKPVQVMLHAIIVTVQCYLVVKRIDLVPVFTPGLAVLAGGLGFTLQESKHA